MMPFTRQMGKIGHFLQPLSRAMGHNVMAILLGGVVWGSLLGLVQKYLIVITRIAMKAKTATVVLIFMVVVISRLVVLSSTHIL